jgi:hypothetical protein
MADGDVLIVAVLTAPHCTRCGGLLERHLVFCMACGARNPGFLEEELQYHHEATLAEKLEDCRRGHPEYAAACVEAVMSPDDLELPLPYCPWCGAKVGSPGVQ